MIVLVRHGQSEYNKKCLTQGQADNPLTEQGENEAKEVSEKLKDFHFDFMVVSPLMRTKRTAEIINEKFNLEVIYDEKLMERNKGSLSGTPKSDIKAFEKFEKDPHKFGGETLKEFYNRCVDAFKKYQNMNKDILIVSHGGVYRSIYKYLNNINYNEKIKSCDNCAIYICEKER